jgi:hypothetical protein
MEKREGRICSQKKLSAGIPVGNRQLGSEKANFALGLIGFRPGGGPTMGTEIFKKIPGGENKEQSFTSRGCGLTLGAKEQRCPKRFKLPWIFPRNRRTMSTHPWLWSGTHGKWRHRHNLDLSEGFRIGQDFLLP